MTLNVFSLDAHQCGRGWLPPEVHDRLAGIDLDIVGLTSANKVTEDPPLYSWSFQSDAHPVMAISSDNFWIWQWFECVQTKQNW